MEFGHPTSNGYTERCSCPWLWTLLFGCFYFAVKGAWRHVFISFFAASFTMGISWLIYPFFANEAIRNTYLRKGWVEIIPLEKQVEVHPQ